VSTREKNETTLMHRDRDVRMIGHSALDVTPA
jgi:hypothetical protein